MRPAVPRLARAVALALAFVCAAGTSSPQVAAADAEAAKKAFLEAVKKGDWKARRAAYAAFADADGAGAARTILDHALEEKNAAVVATALDVLQRFGSPGARATLLDALKKGKPTERLFAAYALAQNRSPEVDAALVETLGKDGGPAAAEAATALAASDRGAGAVPALVRALAAEAPQVRVAAAHALAALAPKEAAAPLVERLKVEKGRPRAAVVAALEAISKKRLGDAPQRWAAWAAGSDPAAVDEKPALPPTFFGIPVTGERVVFVIDRSLLMGRPHPLVTTENQARLAALCSPPDGERIPFDALVSKLQLAVAHVRHAVDGLPAGSRVEVLSFAADVHGVFEKKLTPLGGATRKTLSEGLSALRVEDGINLYGALVEALDLGGPTDEKAWRSGPEEVFLVTNNLPTAGEVQDSEAIGLGIGVRARLRGVAVHVVGIGDHPFRMAETLAKRSGGAYLDLSK